MFADFVVPFWNWLFRHSLQVGITRTVDAVRIGERFGKIRLGKAEEVSLVEIVKLRSLFSWHRFVSQASIPHSDRTALYMAGPEPLQGTARRKRAFIDDAPDALESSDPLR